MVRLPAMGNLRVDRATIRVEGAWAYATLYMSEALPDEGIVEVGLAISTKAGEPSSAKFAVRRHDGIDMSSRDVRGSGLGQVIERFQHDGTELRLTLGRDVANLNLEAVSTTAFLEVDGDVVQEGVPVELE